MGVFEDLDRERLERKIEEVLREQPEDLALVPFRRELCDAETRTSMEVRRHAEHSAVLVMLWLNRIGNLPVSPPANVEGDLWITMQHCRYRERGVDFDHADMLLDLAFDRLHRGLEFVQRLQKAWYEALAEDAE